jgi:hypothetical protein
LQGQATGGGLLLNLSDGATARVTDNRVQENELVSNIATIASSGAIWVGSRGHAEVRRNRWFGGVGPAGLGSIQLSLISSGSGIDWSDDIVAAGSDGGASLEARDGSTLTATNVTVTDHPRRGLSAYVPASGRVTISNSIVFDNEPNTHFFSPVELRRNLIGVDPRFVDSPRRDYRLLPGSPAIDFGDDAPPGGLQPIDIGGLPRRSGAAVDAGAHEAPSGLCRIDRLGEVPGVPATTPACACFRDDAARHLRCGFFLTDLFFEARVPLPFVPGAKLTTDWTIHPWTSGTAPYAMAAGLLDKQGTRLPLDPPGHASGKLVPAKDVAVRIGLVTPESPTVLRLLLRHQPPGAAKPVDSVVEILVPQY